MSALTETIAELELEIDQLKRELAAEKRFRDFLDERYMEDQRELERLLTIIPQYNLFVGGVDRDPSAPAHMRVGVRLEQDYAVRLRNREDDPWWKQKPGNVRPKLEAYEMRKLMKALLPVADKMRAAWLKEAAKVAAIAIVGAKNIPHTITDDMIADVDTAAYRDKVGKEIMQALLENTGPLAYTLEQHLDFKYIKRDD